MKRLRYVRLSAGRRAAIWGIFLLAAVMGLMCVAVLHMKPILTNLAAASVSNTVNRIVVTAVYDAVSAGEVDYDDLVHLEKDQSGHVAAVRSDMAAFNRLQSRIADSILQRLSEVSTRELEIPVGTLTGSSLLAGRGPCIRIRMQAVGSTTAKLRNAFTAAGINQNQPDQASDPAGCHRADEYSPAGLPHLHPSLQRDHRGGDHHHRQRTGYLHLLQHHAGGGRAVR